MDDEKDNNSKKRDPVQAARNRAVIRLLEKWSKEDPAYDEAVGEALEQIDRELEEESKRRREGRDESAA